MSIPALPMSALERPRNCIAIAVALFVGIFVLRLVAPATGDGVTFLYVLPVVLVAIGLGSRAGLVATALAFVLSTAWVLLTGIPISALGYLDRVVVFAFVAVLVGRFAADLRAAEADSARHFNLSMDMICIAGFDGRFKVVNPAFERILGYRREDLVGRPFLDFVHPDDREKTEREAAALAEGNTTVQFRNRYFDRDGRVHWLEWASVPLLDEHIIYGVARDITDRKELEQELERRSQRDPLTGAFNRRRFDEELTNRLVDARRYERKGALLLADLDRLKQINDELGHGAGDLALCEVARLFDENLRGGDAIGRDADGIVPPRRRRVRGAARRGRRGAGRRGRRAAGRRPRDDRSANRREPGAALDQRRGCRIRGWGGSRCRDSRGRGRPGALYGQGERRRCRRQGARAAPGAGPRARVTPSIECRA